MDSVSSRSRSPSVDGNGNGNAEKQKEGEKEEKQETKLSLSEFRAYNRLAEHMEQFVRIHPIRLSFSITSKYR